MPLEYAGVALLPLIVALVQAAKRAFGPGIAMPLALALGLFLRSIVSAAGLVPWGEAFATALLQGLAIGLAAAGLYDVGRAATRPRPADEGSAPSATPQADG